MNFLIMIFQKINFIISYIFANQINEKEIISRVASHENPLVFEEIEKALKPLGY